MTAGTYLIIILVVLVTMSPAIYMVASLSGNLNKSIGEFSGNQMRLYKKNASLRHYVKIRSHKNIAIGRTGEQIHVGAVTVSGVTSGGIYKTGNDLYVAESKKSGRYELVYVKNFHGFTKEYQSIDTIVLTRELLSDAMKSYISEYVDYTKSCILVTDYRNVNISGNEMYQSVMETMQLTNSSGSAGMNGIGGASMKVQEKSNAAYPTKNKCEAILAWMAGEEKPVSEEDEQDDEVNKDS